MQTITALLAMLGATALAWVAAAITGFTQLNRFNDGRVTADEAQLTIVAAVVLAAALTGLSLVALAAMRLRQPHG
jgi:hypothetical protein